jgi:hypothetical protein
MDNLHQLVVKANKEMKNIKHHMDDRRFNVICTCLNEILDDI